MTSRLKKFSIYVACLLFYINFSLYAQNDYTHRPGTGQIDLESQKPLLTIISVDLHNIPFEEALQIIADKCAIRLNYNSSRIPVNKKVSVAMNQVPAIRILFRIFEITRTTLKITGQGSYAIIPSNKEYGKISGEVTEKKTGNPVAGANIIVVGESFGAGTDTNGRFLIPRLSAGIYTLESSMIGYGIKRIRDVIVTEGTTVNLHIELADTLLSLRTIVVTPGNYSLMEKAPVSARALSAENIRSFPQIGEDIYRAITRLPGVTGNDVSAKFNIRGGTYDETLVLLDGMELYDPFHLKDLDGFFSIIDVEAIRNINMMTGAFSAEYGDRLGAVFDMRTVNPGRDNRKTSLALSFLNARFLTQGGSSNGKLRWLLLGRRGYLDLLLKWLNPEDNIEPIYYDLLSKFEYAVNPNHLLSVSILAADDHVVLTETSDGLKFNSSYGTSYLWLNWHAQFQRKLTALTVLFFGKSDQDGDVNQIPMQDAEFEGEVRINRDFSFYGFKQNWEYEFSDDILLRWGLNVKTLMADYDFFFRKPVRIGRENGENIYDHETTVISDKPDGTQYGLYLSNRFRVYDPVTMEVGFRYDYASWAEDKNISPRVNMAYELSRRFTFRLGWGMFYQTQGIHKLNATDGENRFYPAELAEHRVAGIDYEFRNGIRARVEAYQKKLSKIRPRYHNFRGFILNPVGEIHDDRIRVEPERGESKGFELYIKNDRNSSLSWWISYSYAIAEDIINGVEIPRDFDQRHTLYLDLNYQPNKRWRFNVAWQYHSGWPYTESRLRVINEWPDGYIDYDWEPGPLNAQRLPDYHRLDIRATRTFETSSGRISAFLEIRNVYNRRNTREYIYEYEGIENGNHVVKRTGTETLLPLLPSFGITWEF